MALALPRGTLAEKREGMEGVGGRREGEGHGNGGGGGWKKNK